MIKSYLKSALRKIWREPFYSVLNIAGFSFSMSLSLLILVIVGNQFDYDEFNLNKERIFRVNTIVEVNNVGQTRYATSPNSLKDMVDESVISEWVSLVPAYSRFKTFQNNHVSGNGYYAEGDFFSFFQIPLLTGNLSTILSNPNDIALSKDMSMKLFNSLDIIGKSIDIEGLGTFIVSGVFDMAANKTHLDSDFILSQTTMRQLVNREKLDAGLLKESNYAAGYFYIMAKHNLSPGALVGTMGSLAGTINSQTIENNKDAKVSFFTQPLAEISPGMELWLENGRGLSYSVIGLFILIVCVLLALTCFNYSSSMTSLGLSKSKEIGVRKIVGASKRNIFFQFIAESMIIAFVSFGIGMALFPFLIEFSAFQRLTNDLSFNAEVFIILILFVLSVGFVAGFLPAITLSKLKEKDMLFNVFNKNIMRGISLRKMIIVLQFSIAMVMILFAATMIKQTQFMVKGDYGFDYADVISINIQNQKEYTVIKDEFARMPEVLSVSFISTNLGYMPTEEFNSWQQNRTDTVVLSAYYSDENAVSDLGLSIVSGNNFSGNQSLNLNQILLNEKALDLLDLGEPALAIGREVHLNDSARYTIVGVIKDFHFQNFKRSIAPMAFLYGSNLWVY